jgi:hypothetical protein
MPHTKKKSAGFEKGRPQRRKPNSSVVDGTLVDALQCSLPIPDLSIQYRIRSIADNFWISLFTSDHFQSFLPCLYRTISMPDTGQLRLSAPSKMLSSVIESRVGDGAIESRIVEKWQNVERILLQCFEKAGISGTRLRSKRKRIKRKS